MSLDPRTPVLVGAGVAHQHVDDPDGGARSDRAHGARVRTRRSASLLARVQSMLVPRGTWRYRDPGRLLATRFGAADARTVIGEFGILQQTLVTRACTCDRPRRLDVALVVGGEAKYRDLRARIAGTQASETEQVGRATPDDVLVPAAEIIPPDRDRRRPHDPGCAVRGDRDRVRAGRGRDGRAPRARALPGCGRGSARSRRRIPTRGGGTRSRPDVPVGAVGREPDVRGAVHEGGTAHSGTSTRRRRSCCAPSKRRSARASPRGRGCSRSRRSSRTRWSRSSRRGALHRAPAVTAGARAARRGWRCRPRDADHLDLYSCFPSAVQVQADELGSGDDRSSPSPAA